MNNHFHRCSWCNHIIFRQDKRATKAVCFDENGRLEIYEQVCGECNIIQYGITLTYICNDMHHGSRMIGLLWTNELDQDERKEFYNIGIKKRKENSNLIKEVRRGKATLEKILNGKY